MSFDYDPTPWSQLTGTAKLWWFLSMAHEHRDRASRAARRGDFDDAGEHYGSAHDCYDLAASYRILPRV